MMLIEPTLAVAFTPGRPEDNPNVKAPAYGDHHRTYLSAMHVCFGSFRRWNPTLRIQLITTAALPGEYASKFSALGVDSTIVPFNHRPPPGYAKAFATSLYMLDAAIGVDGNYVFVDPDVLCVGPVDSILDELKMGRGGVLKLPTSEDEDVNGLTLRQAGEIYRDLGSELTPVHFGGEFYAIPNGVLQTLPAKVDAAWTYCLDRFNHGESRFLTEEHFLSWALHSDSRMIQTSSVARIWTAHRYRRIPPNYRDIPIWHLPAEKERGFRTLEVAVQDQTSWFWTASQQAFVARASQITGVRLRSPARIAMRAAAVGLRR